MPVVFRSLGGRVLVVVVTAICLFGLAYVFDEGGAAEAARSAPWLALVAGACLAMFWRPQVSVDDSGVTLVNVFRTVALPWPSIHLIDTKWSLTLETAYGRYSAWAAPAPGAVSALRSTRRDAQHLPASSYTTEGARPGDLPSTRSGGAATYIRRRWEELRDQGFLDDPKLDPSHQAVRWHTGVLAGGAAVLALAVITLLI